MEYEVKIDGRPVVRIHASGKIEYLTGKLPDQAAAAFWAQVARQNPLSEALEALAACSRFLDRHIESLVEAAELFEQLNADERSKLDGDLGEAKRLQELIKKAERGKA